MEVNYGAGHRHEDDNRPLNTPDMMTQSASTSTHKTHTAEPPCGQRSNKVGMKYLHTVMMATAAAAVVQGMDMITMEPGYDESTQHNPAQQNTCSNTC